MFSKEARVATFWVGVVLYALSFFLYAVIDGFELLRGWQCAETVTGVWMNFRQFAGQGSFQGDKLAFICVMITSVINPVFIFSAVRKNAILNRVLLFMFAANLVLLFRWPIQPREGYFVWLAGMLAVMYSDRPWTKDLPARARRTRR